MPYEGKRLVTVSVTTDLVANTTYAANTVMSDSASAGAVWNFANVTEIVGGTGYIVKAQAIAQANTTPRLRVFLFNSGTLTCNVNSNVASNAPAHADLAKYIGGIDVPALENYTGDSYSIATPSTAGNLPLAFQCASDNNCLYGIVMTKDATANITTLKQLTIKLTAELF